jgi:methionyl-tRNA formyltransferase
VRIIYLGTPEFAVPTLEKLISWDGAEVVGLVTQPDRPAGRGNKVIPPPTKVVAEKHGIPVLQPEKLSKSPDVVQSMRDMQPDVLVMVAFGQILKKEVLTMAPMGVVNLHGSVLPALRGAAPINWSIINGDKTAGITTMFSEAGVDTGPMLLKHEVQLGQDTTAEELAHELSIIGADLVLETLKQLQAGTLQGTPQDDSLATMAPRLDKELGRIDWSQAARKIHNLVRGLVPWPGTFTTFRGDVLKIHKTARVNAKRPPGAAVGELFQDGGNIFVACGPNADDAIQLIEVQPPNKARMSARDWMNGAHVTVGERLGVDIAKPVS